jgi:hypothetical protein
MKLKVSASLETLSELQQIVAKIPGATSQDAKRQQSGGLNMTLKDYGDVFIALKDFAELSAALIALHTAWRSANKPPTTIGVSTPGTHADVRVGGDATPASIEGNLKPLRGER